jgi:hypothetical protein
MTTLNDVAIMCMTLDWIKRMRIAIVYINIMSYQNIVSDLYRVH